jgi:hypothetical protein
MALQSKIGDWPQKKQLTEELLEVLLDAYSKLAFRRSPISLG